MNDLAAIYNILIENNEKTDIFHPGPFNLTDNSERIHLDELFKPTKENFNAIVDFVLHVFNEYLDKRYLVGIIDHSETNQLDLDKEVKTSVEECGIILSEEYVIDSFYEPEDLWYTTIRLQYDIDSNLKKYIEGILRPHIHIEGPYLKAEIVFISLNADYLLNLYDDRGIDIVQLRRKTGHNN